MSGSLVWFARHEARLAWRDMLAMMTAGRPDRERKVAIGILIVVAGMHLVAFLALRQFKSVGPSPDLSALVAVTVAGLLSGSAMLSQAMESVTRAFYSRSDLELILSSPTSSERLFAVRIAAMALSVGLMSLLLIGPFIDVLAWKDGVRWLGAYGAIVALALMATSLGLVLTIALLETIGPKRTRLAAQIAAAVVGSVFVIGLQMAALFSSGMPSRVGFVTSRAVLTRMPDIHSVVWWPGRAALGDWGCLAIVLPASIVLSVAVTILLAPRFADYSVQASSVAQARVQTRASRAFRIESPSSALRRKERLLLLRDPWLVSQSLMQLLYLLPPALLLWRSFASDGGVSIILVSVLIMAAGQLAGGLAWLTISGEDAPELVATAPISPALVLRAKMIAVMECTAIVFLPFVAGLALVSPGRALIAAIGIAASAMSAATIQLWFRTQAKRSQFRRRHTSSRIATFSEAFSSIAWAATGVVAAAGSWLAGILAVFALGILAGVRLLSPARRATAGLTSHGYAYAPDRASLRA